MEQRIIKPVQNNTEKQLTYQSMMRRYKQALDGGFFCEALMIDYAMIEDRLRSMIYHMGFLADREKRVIWKKARPVLQPIVNEYKEDGEDDSLGLTSLGAKIKIIRSVFKWVAYTEGGYQENAHLTVLKSQLESIDPANVLSVLDSVDSWRKYRNEVVHAMMNKNVCDLEESLRPYAEEGMKLARSLDAIEKQIKSGNRIRRKINLPMR